MSHLTELQCVMYADDALTANEAASVAAHIDVCSECTALVARIRQEAQALQLAFALDDAPVSVPALLPDFTKPISLGQFAIANLCTGLLVWLGQFLWKTLFGDFVISAISWFTLIPVPDVFDLTVNAITFFSTEGTSMIDTYISFIGFFVIASSLAWLAFSFRQKLRGVQLCLAAMLGLGLLAPAPSDALEVRHDDKLTTIEADQTIDDSIVIFGDTITIDGKVTGNVIAMGERVIVRGEIDGTLISAAETITISGKIGGSAVTAGSSIELRGARIAGDFLGAAGDITLGDATVVGSNAALASERIAVDGRVNRDLWAFGESVEISGAVGEDLEIYTKRLNLLGNASVGGNLRIRTDADDNLQVASNARIGGTVEFLPPAEKTAENRYLTGRFYAGQLLYLGGQLIVGIALFWLIPGLMALSLAAGIEGLKTMGIGLVALVSMPIIALLAAVTLIGLPIGIMGFVAWGLALYLAKILLASVIGRALLSGTGRQHSLPLVLLAGLSIVLAAINLPLIGGVISFLLTIAGLGLLVQVLLSYLSNREQHRA